MDNRPHLHLRSTKQVLKHSSLSFFASFPTLLTLSLILFSFKIAVEHGTLQLTAFLQKQPSVQSLFSPSPSSENTLAGNGDDPHPGNPKTPGNRRPFLLLTRGGTLDDDFFSDDFLDDPNLYGRVTFPANGSFMSFPNLFRPVGPDVIAVVKSGSFEMVKRVSDLENSSDSMVPDRENAKMVGKELVVNRANVATLMFLVFGVSSAFGWLLVGFLELYSCVLGVVCFAVITGLVGRDCSLVRSVWSGSRLGIRRLTMIMLLKWATREALTQFLSICFYSGIEEQHTLVHLIMRLKLMPFSVNSTWIHDLGLGREVSLRTTAFLFAWFFFDFFLSLFHTVDCWVAVMDARRSIEDSVIEGCRLMYIMFRQAIMLKALESIFAGLTIRRVIARNFGATFATFFQSVVEIYFLVVWLRFFIAARSKFSRLESRRFGLRDLEEFLERNG